MYWNNTVLCFRQEQLLNIGESHSSNYWDANNPARHWGQRAEFNVSWSTCSEQAQDFPRLLFQGSPQWFNII